MTQHSSDEKGRAGQGFLCQDGLPDPAAPVLPRVLPSGCAEAELCSHNPFTGTSQSCPLFGSARNTAELPCQEPYSTKPRMSERSRGGAGLQGHPSRQVVIPSAQHLSGHTWNPAVGFGPHYTRVWTGRVTATETIQGQGSRHVGKGWENGAYSAVRKEG